MLVPRFTFVEVKRLAATGSAQTANHHCVVPKGKVLKNYFEEAGVFLARFLIT